METKQQSKIYYHCAVPPFDGDPIQLFGIELSTEEVTIRKAYFGRYTAYGKHSLGLNIWVDRGAGALYTNLEDVEGLMDDLGVSRIEELVGRKVISHNYGQWLIGLSVPEEHRSKAA